MIYKKVCADCGKDFESEYKSAVYCSKNCREMRSIIKDREGYQKRRNTEVEKKCTVCGKIFIKSRTSVAEVCSKECKEKKKNTKTGIDETNRSAREAGLSYGKYVALQYLKDSNKF